MVCVDNDGVIVLVNAAVERLFGYAPSELIGKPVEMLVPDSVRDVHHNHRRKYLSDPHARPMGSGLQLAVRRKDGTEIPVDISLSAVDLDGQIVVATSIRDVSDRVRDQAALRSAELKFNSAFFNAPIGIALIDGDGYISLANDALSATLGRKFALPGEVLLTSLAHGDDAQGLHDAMVALSSRKIESYKDECRFLSGTGELVWLALSAVPASDVEDVPSLVVQFEDITERRRVVEVLEFQALHDPLTNLPNRTLLADRIQRALARAARTGRMTAALYVDIDRFKTINDVFGHDVGDETILALAMALNREVRTSDTLARLGGDELVVLVTDLRSQEEGVEMAERLRAIAAEPLVIAGRTVRLTVSIGIAFIREGMGVSDVLRAADSAMYAAKHNGKNCCAVYDEAMRVVAAERLSMEELLKGAVLEDRVVVHYQPIVDVRNGRLSGVEALVRIKSDEGLIHPVRFIDIAEESGLIAEIGTTVMNEACRQQALWMKELGPKAPPRLGVNLSTHQLIHGGIVEAVSTCLTESGLSAECLDLEITETSYLEATGSVVQAITDLRNFGVRLGVDDFGTGYASLTYLKRLPIDFVKIDASFVKDMPNDPVDDAIVRSVIDLGHVLNLTTIAEGVEREEQLAVLASAGCDLAQGYYFSPGLSPDEMEAFIEAKGQPTSREGITAQV